ncbi:hypothetical protein [Mucilaginibacter gotjawali]|uniref:Membrane protein YgcG n=1 Tax=Mucilaginibacter gotjawali TaxID=1550579 RepID=A0A839SDN5_9SPHI|nr:hypothetical protein [Mucilaginibacter gotjawali]MBB3054769.1 putative membrane protein YgcG [Mucilaginibacter gotjawali]
MISYNKTWLASLRVKAQLHQELKQGNITKEEFAAFNEKYPVGFYTPNILGRIGLFILTIVIIVFTDALLSQMVGQAAERAGWFCFLSLLSYTALELLVHFKFHYRSGVDDALLVLSGIVFTGTVYYLIYGGSGSGSTDKLAFSEIVFIVSLWLTIRFNDMLAAAFCSGAFFGIILFGWTRTGSMGVATAPFVIMFAAAFVFLRLTYYKNKKALINYQNSLLIAQIVGLVVFYAAGNYYVVQVLGDELKGIDSSTHTAVPFAVFFWAWTMLLPLIYIAIGLMRKDKLFIRLGMVLVAAAVITYKNYYHLLPVDVEFTIAGAALLALVYGITRYLKTPKHGFTKEDIDEDIKADEINVESVIVGSEFSDTPTAPADNGVKFGGGDFGGGGASGGF